MQLINHKADWNTFLQNNLKSTGSQSFQTSNLEIRSQTRVNSRQCVYYQWCFLSCTAINIWVAYFWRGKEEAMKLDSTFLFATRKQDIFIYRLIAECSGSSPDKRFTSWVTVRTGLVTAEEVSQGFIYSHRFTWCIWVPPVSSSSLKMCASEALAPSSPARHGSLGAEGQSGSRHGGRRCLPAVWGRGTQGSQPVHQQMFCGPQHSRACVTRTWRYFRRQWVN